MNMITEEKRWELVEIGRENVKNIGLMDEIMERDKIECSFMHLLKSWMEKAGMNGS